MRIGGRLPAVRRAPVGRAAASVRLADRKLRVDELILIQAFTSVVLASLLECLADNPVRQARRVALPGQHPCEPPYPHLDWLPRSSVEPALDERPGGGQFGLGGELGDRRLDVAALHPALVQLGRQGTAAKATAMMPGLHPGVSEHGVIDESNLGEPAEHCICRILRHSPAPEGRGELGPCSRSSRQLAEANQARNRLRVGLLLGGVTRAVAVGPAVVAPPAAPDAPVVVAADASVLRAGRPGPARGLTWHRPVP